MRINGEEKVTLKCTIDHTAIEPSEGSAERGAWAVDSLRANTRLLMPTQRLGADQNVRLELMADSSSIITAAACSTVEVALE